MANVAIIGAGMMGSAMAIPLVDAGHGVSLVGTPLDESIIASVRDTGVHPKMGLALPELSVVGGPELLADVVPAAELVVIGVSSAGVDWASQHVGPHLRDEQTVLMVTKGLRFDGSVLRVLPDVFQSALPEGLRVSPVAIGGPCIAGELARRVPTCVVFSGRSPIAASRARELARGGYYHVTVEDDLVGVEVCAALKNAYAMGVAFPVGMHEKRGGGAGSIALHNLESAIVAQSLREMSQVVALCGGRPITALGLAGAGDLDVTNNGGRTGRFGRLLGLGMSREAAIEGMQGATLECLEILTTLSAALSAWQAAGKADSKAFPLLRHLIDVAILGAPVDPPLRDFFA